MPTLKFVRTRQNENTPYSDVSSTLHERHSYRFYSDNTRLSRIVRYTFTTRSALNAYMNDPERFTNRDASNAYDADHGIVTRAVVLDGNNSGSVRFNPVTSTYDVTPMTEDEANAWVMEIAVA